MAAQPLVSVVMPSFNQAQFIGLAIDSVLQQSWQRLELVVQDGGSTDGTLELLARKQAEDPRLRWVSEPDEGPADAINKALKRARGTYIGWLNSDDLYEPGAVERAVAAMQTHPWLLCYGQGKHIDAAGENIALYPTLPEWRAASPQVPPAHEFQRGCFICQPTVFFKAVVLRLLGPLDAEIKASFDFEFWLRAFSAFPERIGYVPAIQACSRLHEATITHEQRLTVAIEGIKVLAKHQGSAQSHWLISFMNEQLARGRRPEDIIFELESVMFSLIPLLADGEPLKLEDAMQMLKAKA